jgi:hypothetical protein
MRTRFFASALVLVLGVSATLFMMRSTPIVDAAEPTKPDAAAVTRARDEVQKLDTLYKTAVVGITKVYVDKQSDTPAATLAKAVFAEMHKKGYHNARLIDATGKPKDQANLPQTDFEKKAVAAMKEGKQYYEEIGAHEGKPVLRAGTIVPAVMKQCVLCHGGKEGALLGVIVYEIPIK